MIFETTLPRISHEIKYLLQLSPDTRTGDWYIFENHTMIRVYGFEEELYLLPTFLTPIIYSLEYIRQRITADLFHFVNNNKALNFKLQ